MKKFFLVSCVFLLIATQTLILISSNRAYGYENEEDEMSFFYDVPEFDPDQFKQACNLTPFDIVSLLTGPDIMIQDILMHQFYLRTAPPIVRALQTEPVLEARPINLCDGQNRFSAKLFFNQMRKVYLSPCSPYIDSFLDITNTDLVAAIDHALTSFGLNVNIPEIFPLLTTIKLEQRRIGAMLIYQRRTDEFEWRFLLPVYYIEHNFFLTQKEQDDIADAPIFQQMSNNSQNCSSAKNDEGVRELLQEHLVNDAFGIGDLRGQIFYDIVTTDCTLLSIGLELNFPSAITLAKGLIGRTYPTCPAQPTINYYDLFCLAQEYPLKAQHAGMAFGFAALDRLTEVAAQNNLGALHMGIGFLAEFDVHFDEEHFWRNNGRLFYSCPANEARYFRPTKTAAEFNRDYSNSALTLENLNFLNEQTVLLAFPPVTKTRVTPGLVLQYTTGLDFDYGWFKAEIGYDYWHKTRESLDIVDYYNAPEKVDVELGVQPAATQQKAFLTLSFDHCDSCRHWRFVLFGETTFANEGIGKDWMLGFDVSTLF